MIPWFERPIIYDVRARPHLVESTSGSRDLQMVSANFLFSDRFLLLYSKSFCHYLVAFQFSKMIKLISAYFTFLLYLTIHALLLLRLE